jgi:hypothetical protein
MPRFTYGAYDQFEGRSGTQLILLGDRALGRQSKSTVENGRAITRHSACLADQLALLDCCKKGNDTPLSGRLPGTSTLSARPLFPVSLRRAAAAAARGASAGPHGSGFPSGIARLKIERRGRGTVGAWERNYRIHHHRRRKAAVTGKWPLGGQASCWRVGFMLQLPSSSLDSTR